MRVAGPEIPVDQRELLALEGRNLTVPEALNTSRDDEQSTFKELAGADVPPDVDRLGRG